MIGAGEVEFLEVWDEGSAHVHAVRVLLLTLEALLNHPRGGEGEGKGGEDK